MICGTLATFPPRRDSLVQTVAALAPQLDRLIVVLNEYTAPLPELDDYANVEQSIPPEDLKDTGKFWPETDGAEWVFTFDDDLIYPSDYVARSLEAWRTLPPGRYLCGYHGALYEKPRFSLSPKAFLRWARYRDDRIAIYRRPLRFRDGQERALIADQLGSGTTFLRREDAPPFAFMKGSQRYVDVRLARWAFENGLTPVALPRRAGWLSERRHEDTIFRSFTRKNPPHVAKEIWTYALKVKGRGTVPGGQA